MMPLLAALDGIIAVLVVAVASPGIELCALRDGKKAGSSEADVTACMGRVSATETVTEGRTFCVCECDASVAKSRVVVVSTELAVRVSSCEDTEVAITSDGRTAEGEK